jgi:hypothetical protein
MLRSSLQRLVQKWKLNSPYNILSYLSQGCFVRPWLFYFR